jgi:hypothetical protein
MLDVEIHVLHNEQKHTRKPFAKKKKAFRATNRLKLIQSDLCGLKIKPSFGGVKF